MAGPGLCGALGCTIASLSLSHLGNGDWRGSRHHVSSRCLILSRQHSRLQSQRLRTRDQTVTNSILCEGEIPAIPHVGCARAWNRRHVPARWRTKLCKAFAQESFDGNPAPFPFGERDSRDLSFASPSTQIGSRQLAIWKRMMAPSAPSSIRSHFVTAGVLLQEWQLNRPDGAVLLLVVGSPPPPGVCLD